MLRKTTDHDPRLAARRWPASPRSCSPGPACCCSSRVSSCSRRSTSGPSVGSSRSSRRRSTSPRPVSSTLPAHRDERPSARSRVIAAGVVWWMTTRDPRDRTDRTRPAVRRLGDRQQRHLLGPDRHGPACLQRQAVGPRGAGGAAGRQRPSPEQSPSSTAPSHAAGERGLVAAARADNGWRHT